jgi:hypothetical protein
MESNNQESAQIELVKEVKKKEKKEKKETPAGPKQVYRPKVKATNEGEPVQHQEESKVEETPKETVTDT